MPSQVDPSARGVPVTPTRTRHWVLLFAATLAIITYVDRVCISQAAPDIQRELHLDKRHLGWAFGAFAWAYALFEIPGGWLGDRIGPRSVLMRVVILWSFFTAATGWVWSFGSLLVTRFLFGVGEAGCFPNLAKVFSIWMPASERSRALGVMWLSARWGGSFTPKLVVMTLALVSWRWAFGLFGLIGILWAVLFFRWFRDRPREHPAVNAGELALLADADENAGGHGRVPWKTLLTSPTVLMLWLQYFCFSYGWYFYITWLPTYLREGRGLETQQAAVYAGFPLFFGGVGSILSGWLFARLAALTGDVRKTRRGICYVGFALAGILLLASAYIQDPLAAMIAMGFSSFALDLTLPCSWGACLDVGGRCAGTLSGSMNMMGNIAGGVAPVVVGYLLDHSQKLSPSDGSKNWLVIFWISAVIYLLGGLCWRWTDPVTPLEERKGMRF
jgi:MFS family permease